MNTALGSNTLATLALTALAAGFAWHSGAQAAPPAGAELKWTPHRASVPESEPAPESPRPDTPAPLTVDRPVRTPSAPATVSLPDDVPAAPARREATAPRSRRPAPRDDMRSRQPADGMSAALGNVYDPTSPDNVLGFNIMRTPQGPARRPILAPEGGQAIAMRAAADRAATGEARLGGGLAPRYSPSRQAGRPERLAMNVEGIPSVMTQAPQVGGPDDAGLPGRAPAATDPGDRLPDAAEGVRDAAPSADPEIIDPGLELPGGPDVMEGDPTLVDPGLDGGLLMGEYPAEMHVESFYDDPYACEDEEGMLMCEHHGRICAWLRRFGRPYYGWRWYRDFTASAGITSFTNSTDLGIHGNFGTNQYLNWAMPFWNAFGVGWQVGWRGTQTNFQPTRVEAGSRTFQLNARDQQFVTTGFFTRAFEGRGLQGGAVYDYLHDSWLDNTDVAQLRYELSYVWGYHELGFWGASNIGDQIGLFSPITKSSGVAETLDLYTGFYRLQFGDANEWKVWGGGTSEGQGIVGTLVRAPMQRSLALEGTFTYVIPGNTQSINFDGAAASTSYAPSAWNVAVNVVWYPAGRSRRSLASPYRPLFDVADNGSMIRTIQRTSP